MPAGTVSWTRNRHALSRRKNRVKRLNGEIGHGIRLEMARKGEPVEDSQSLNSKQEGNGWMEAYQSRQRQMDGRVGHLRRNIWGCRTMRARIDDLLAAHPVKLGSIAGRLQVRVLLSTFPRRTSGQISRKTVSSSSVSARMR